MKKRVAVILTVAGVLMVAAAQAGADGRLRSVDDSDRIVLPGNVHPLARPEFDIGRSDGSLPEERMILTLAMQPAKKVALGRLLVEQQDPGSPNFHRWLTPEEFGARFGATQDEVDVVTGWLRSHGFVIDEVGNGRTWINFTGTVADVESAFHTEIHDYLVDGDLHHANATDPSIPRALASLVVGLVSLHDFRKAPASHVVRPKTDLANGENALAPGDFATIYDVNPLYSAGIDGTGQSIAVVGRTNIRLTDVQDFRSFSGLPAHDPQFIINGTDPGIADIGDETEADLDVEWSGGVAKGATVKFVISMSTTTSDGVDLSAQYVVDNNIAPVMTTSYGACESLIGIAGEAFYGQLEAQAAAQGITSFVSSGDSGAAGCDASSSSTATGGPAVSGLCSPPYDVCVGGTEFLDAATNTYWSAVNDATTHASALSYIPEEAWNESGTAGVTCPGDETCDQLWATGGGPSIVFSKPYWQVAPGVPADGARDVPDVSLAAATHTPYIVFRGSLSPSSHFIGVGGTSASTPSFAGLMALIVQQAGARQGNANPRLYQLANAQYGGAGPTVFHDVTTGNNSVPGQAGFSCTPGYDLATGLGSVDASALANAWGSPCSFSLSSGSQVFSGLGGTGSVGVTVTSGGNCSWTAATNAPAWVHITSGASGTGNGKVGYTVDASTGNARSGTLTIAEHTFTVNQEFTYWVPVASHAAGKNSSQWRSDIGLLNAGAAAANVQINFFGGSGVVSGTLSVPAQSQSVLVDVVNGFPASGSGAVEVVSDQALEVTTRTYNEVSPTASCYPDGTQGQDYPAVVAGDGLATGQSAYLPGLTENASYRCNIGMVNTGAESATVLVELFDGTGTSLASYTVAFAAGAWSQATQPFLSDAGQTGMDRGYAMITVQAGSGVFAFASVIDNITNDPTTVAMQPEIGMLPQQGGKLVGTGAVGAAWQGTSVAISTDGNTAIVGGPSDDSGTGAAWVFTRNGGVWTQQASKLVGTGGSPTGGGQGTSVALSADGNTAIVGAPSASAPDGAAWVYTRNGGAWTQQGNPLVGSGGIGMGFQGWAVALSADGNTAVVGGFLDNSGAGAAWVFTRSGTVWTQQGDKLVGTGAIGNAGQGGSVAISADGNTAIIGGPEDNCPGVACAGAAWVFTRSGGVWSQQGNKLFGTGAVGAAGQGSSVAMSADGNTAIVGGPGDDSGAGATWLFTRSGGVWLQQGNKLLGTGVAGAAGQGSSVAMSGDGNTAIVGGPGDNSGVGASWLFTRTAETWTQQGGKLVGTGAVGPAEQGAALALSADGSTTIVGGLADASNAGAAWVFAPSPSYVSWVPVASHAAGKNDSQWRSDLGLFNSRTATANVQLMFYGSGGVVNSTTTVPSGAQWILEDVVGQFPATGSGAIEVLSDQPLDVTARTYNQVSSTAACYPNGTQGQDYPAVDSSQGLNTGGIAYLAGLTESASYRTNIGLVDTGSDTATALVELFDGAGTELATYTVDLAAGQWLQETQPFLNKAGQTAMSSGYARITVQSGSGVFAFASVIDNITNDPTTVVMQR